MACHVDIITCHNVDIGRKIARQKNQDVDRKRHNAHQMIFHRLAIAPNRHPMLLHAWKGAERKGKERKENDKDLSFTRKRTLNTVPSKAKDATGNVSSEGRGRGTQRCPNNQWSSGRTSSSSSSPRRHVLPGTVNMDNMQAIKTVSEQVG